MYGRNVYSSQCSMHLNWWAPNKFPPCGLYRLYRLSYYSETYGTNATKEVITDNRYHTLYGLESGHTYSLYVQVQTIPNTAYGPRSHIYKRTISCSPSITNEPNPGTLKTTSNPLTTSPATLITTVTTNATEGSPRPNGTVSNTNETIIYGSWSNWTQCNQTCGIGFKTRYRNSSSNLSSTNLTEHASCQDLTKCLDILIDAKLKDEVWNNNLLNTSSFEFITFESKLCANSDLLYGAIWCGVIRCWQGSVMSSLKMRFKPSESDKILALQESIELNNTLGNNSLQAERFYSKSVPPKGPNITSLIAITSRVAQIQWKSVDQNPASFQGFILSYRPINELNWLTATCGTVCTSMTIETLQANTSYRFRLQTFTGDIRGIAGYAAQLVTPPSVSKDVPPPNVKANVVSSTSIMVQWDPLPDGIISGTFLGYRILCQNERTGAMIEETVNSWDKVVIFKVLDKFTWYSIRVFGFSDLGLGVSNPVIRARTLEDGPSAPPSKVTVEDMFSTTSIKIRWEPVPINHMNGIIKGYTLIYQLKDNDNDEDEDEQRQNIHLSPDTLSLTIDNLYSSATYQIELFAYNSAGNGLSAKLSAATCSCNANIYSNYISYPPYASITDAGNLGGIFGSIVQDMIITSCGTCTNGHGKSTFVTSANGKGGKALKQNYSAVQNDIDDITDVSFPINGYVTDTRYMKFYKYISLVESPGIAFLVVRQQAETAANNTLYSVIVHSWMLVILLFSLMYLFGIIFWLAESKSNSLHFPRSFGSGVWEGLWFSFVSMTTVGYGDRTPKSIIGRIVAIGWTIIGLVLLSIFTGMITTASTVVTTELQQEAKLYGSNVSAVENSAEYKAGILKNAKMVGFSSIKETYKSLSNPYIQGVLVDAYVAGSPENIVNQPKDTYVNRVLGKSISYGVVLSGKVTRIAPACREYIKENQAKISKIIAQFVSPIERDGIVESNQTSDDPLPVVYQTNASLDIMDVIKFLAVVLAGFTGIGFLWDFFLKWSRKRNICKLKSYSTDIAEMRDSVRKLYHRLQKISEELKEKHRKELKLFLKRKNNILDGHKHASTC